MKNLVLGVLFVLFSCISYGQAGYVTPNDFSTPFPRTVWWLRSAIPAGSVPVFTLSGTNSARFHIDSIYMNNLSNQNDTPIYKLVSIGSDDRLRAFIPRYLNIDDTTGKWLYAGYIPDWNTITNKPNFLDSATVYTILNGKLNISDTIDKWLPLTTFIPDTLSLSDRIDQKLSISDTTDKWYPRYDNPKPYLVGADTNNLSTLIDTKLDKVDTTTKWTPLSRNLTINGVTQDLSVNRFWSVGTLIANDTINLSNRINGKLDIRYIPTDIDSSDINEIQTLGGTNRTVTLSGGGSFTLPLPNWDSTINKPPQVTITGGLNTKVTGTYPNITVADSTKTRFYDKNGLINQNIKIWSDTLSPNTSNGYSIDISSGGFTRILSAEVIAIRNTSAAASSPNVSIKTITTSAITVNITEDNTATVSILGIGVLSGLPSVFANTTGLKIFITIIGY